MTPETSPIVTQMMAQALASARGVARDQARFAERLRRQAVQVIVDDFGDWLVERDQRRLDAASIDMRRMADGALVFGAPLHREVFIVRLRNGREILAGGRIVPVNELAVLDQDLYGDLKDRLFSWFGDEPIRPNRGAWGR